MLGAYSQIRPVVDAWSEISKPIARSSQLCENHEECSLRDASSRKSRRSSPDKHILLMRFQRSGFAKPSLMGELLDDYDPATTSDAEHEYDLKLVGGIIIGGKIGKLGFGNTGLTMHL